MFDNEKQLQALRKAYKKNLIFNLSAMIVSLLFVGYMLAGNTISVPLVGYIAAGVGAVAAIASYAIELALFRKGKQAFWVLIATLLLPLLALGAVMTAGLLPMTKDASTLPYFVAFIFLRAVIPLIQLLRDSARLRGGDVCETVGAVKKNTRRVEGSNSRESYLLFEDELTHETHLLRVGSLSPQHRHRMFYLPHSGLAVGEPIADNVTFDPFGNPIEREITEDTVTETPFYAEEKVITETPPHTEEYDTEQADDNGEYAPTENQETPYRDSRYDPNSPDRKKAVKYTKASKICSALGIICGILGFVGAALMKAKDTSPAIMLFLIPMVVFIILGTSFESKSLKLRCTKRTIAVCIDTVRRRSGKTTTRRPIVEYEVEGVKHTAELSVSCTRHAVGEIYTIYYDPLEPDTVRVG
ncbi:MAG: hypothetical protein IJW00_09520 [Clostridia bacterium]|nr:hypothetical protein [Clostridia bacterium]